MNLRLQMLQVARLAPNLLEDSTRLVESFLLAQQNTNGGFKDREGRSDLYYSVFALDGLLATRAPLPADSVADYLKTFEPARLDFIHLCCLARCWGTLAHASNVCCPEPIREQLQAKVLSYRSRDGGFNLMPDQPFGSVYAAFLALSALQDLGVPVPDPMDLVQSFKRLECEGGWAND
ncbi:MAG: prenyltransferase/squalene oxidase repeat-containing protein, partial [Limisphaerales bacterium]